MNILIINWLVILVIGFGISRYKKNYQPFISGIISLVIANVITSGIHLLWIPTNNLIWALIAVSYASFCSGFFSILSNKNN
mgnify:CR=1 FL=1